MNNLGITLKQNSKTSLCSRMSSVTTEYYNSKSQIWLKNLTFVEYLRKVDHMMTIEKDVFITEIETINNEMRKTGQEMMDTFEFIFGLQQLNSENITAIWEQVFKAIKDDLDITDIKNCQELKDLRHFLQLYASNEKDCTKMANQMQIDLTKWLTKMVKTAKEEYKPSEKQNSHLQSKHSFCIEIINLYNVLSQTISAHVSQYWLKLFVKAIDVAFEKALNIEYYACALLARYSNEILKKSKISDLLLLNNNLESTMNSIVKMYGYLRDKDIYERDYQQYLSSRLLLGISKSEEQERSMIGKLKTEAGYHWTSKLEDMFKDVQRSKELITDFNLYLRHEKNELGFKFSVNVCTTGAWPSNKVPKINCDNHEILKACGMFEKFYLQKHRGRKLFFIWDNGQADVQVKFNDNVMKTLICSTYQMIILFLFNEKNCWTFKEIYEKTQISKDDCMIHLLSMAHPKVNILLKTPNVKECNDDDKFKINSQYKNASERIVVPIVDVNIQEEKVNEETEAVLKLRRHQTDREILNEMKVNKEMDHAELVTKVIKRLASRFVAKPINIKKRIANLIELEYLERCENNRNRYRYKR